MMDHLHTADHLSHSGSSSTGGPGSVEARNFNLVALSYNNAGINAIIDSKITVNSGKVTLTQTALSKKEMKQKNHHLQ